MKTMQKLTIVSTGDSAIQAEFLSRITQAISGLKAEFDEQIEVTRFALENDKLPDEERRNSFTRADLSDRKPASPTELKTA